MVRERAAGEGGSPSVAVMCLQIARKRQGAISAFVALGRLQRVCSCMCVQSVMGARPRVAPKPPYPEFLVKLLI